MAFSYGFYDSLNHDRMYNAAQFGSIFDGIINDGVYKNYLNGFRVEAGGENKVRVLSGRAWFDHTWSYNSSAMTLDLEKSELRFNRYDMVVIEVNHNRDIRANSVKVIKGTSGVNPQKPKPIRSNNINQYPLAYVYRQSDRDTVEQSDITITIGTAECPYTQLAKGLGSSSGSGSQIVEVEETIDDHQGDPIDGGDGQHLTSSIMKQVEIPSGPGGDQNGSGCDCDPVNIIPVDKVESIFDYPISDDPDPERYFLNGPGLNAFVEAIKKQNLGGDGSGGSGSGCVGTGVCLGNETTFSINTIPDTWINNIFDQGLPEDHDENCEHFLDEDGLLALVNVIKSKGGSSEEGTVLYYNASGTFTEAALADNVANYKYVDFYYLVTPENVNVNTSYPKPETTNPYRVKRFTVTTKPTNEAWAGETISFFRINNAATTNCSLSFYEGYVSVSGSSIHFGGTYKLTLSGTASSNATFYKYTTNYNDTNQVVSIVKIVGYK